MTIIQVYEPTERSEEKEIQKFYEELNSTIQKEGEYYTIIMGDFNAKLGIERTPNKTVGKFDLGERNKRGRELIEFGHRNNLSIGNIFFFKREKKRWTWQAPNKNVKNEIDHFLINDITILKNVNVISKFDFLSDHRIIRNTIKIPGRVRIINFRNANKKHKLIIPESKKREAQEELNEKQRDFDKLIMNKEGVKKAYNK